MKKRIRCFTNGRGSWAFAEVEQGEKRRTPYIELWSLQERIESGVMSKIHIPADFNFGGGCGVSGLPIEFSSNSGGSGNLFR